MELVSSFRDLLPPLAACFTAPSCANFETLLCGWVFAPRRTVTTLILAAGAPARGFARFHRFFARARWSREQLGGALFTLIEPFLTADLVPLALDDTLARKSTLHVWGTGMHYDPRLSSRALAVMNCAHCWLVAGPVVHFPLWPQRAFCLPIACRLWLNQKSCAELQVPYLTKQELAVALLAELAERFPGRRFHVLADSSYGGESVLAHLPEGFELTSRLALNTRLVDAPPERLPGTLGRPRRRGDSLGSPETMLALPGRRVDVEVYGRRDRVRLVDQQARMFKVPERDLRVVAVEPLSGGRPPQAFYSTLAAAQALEVLVWYAWRWSIEVTFHEVKGCLGFEQPPGWTRLAAERTAPMALWLYTLIVLWYVQAGHRLDQSVAPPWYRHKRHASFADMLATLRLASLAEHISGPPLPEPGSPNSAPPGPRPLDKVA